MIKSSAVQIGSLKFFLLFLPVFLFGQTGTPQYRLLAKLPVPAKFFTTDKLQQLYLVTPDNTVIKCSPEGKELFRYNNNTLGPLTQIDATNPFNLLLFYPEFQTALTLDRTLNKIGEFNLWNLETVQVKAVTMAVDNGIWLFDDVAYKLKKVDKNGNVLRQSDNLSLLLGTTPAPMQLLARSNFVYANDPALGLLVFDNFGQYVKTIPLTGIHDFQVLDQLLVFQKGPDFFAYDLATLREMPLPLPNDASEALQIRLQKERLYVLKKEGLEIYSR